MFAGAYEISGVGTLEGFVDNESSPNYTLRFSMPSSSIMANLDYGLSSAH